MTRLNVSLEGVLNPVNKLGMIKLLELVDINTKVY